MESDSHNTRPENSIRALLTGAEIRAVTGEVTDSSQLSTYLHRVRQRIDMLRYDVELLQEYRPEEYAQLREIVCQEHDHDPEWYTERIDALEQRVISLESQLGAGGEGQ